MNILHIEDNAIDADLVRRALARALSDSVLTWVPTLAQARVRLAQQPAVDLVLVDINLPDGNGLDLVRELRYQPDAPALVALTGHGDEALVVAALKAGADDYLAKAGPLDDRLADTLLAVHARHRSRQRRQRRGLRVLYAEHHASDVDLTRRHLALAAPYIGLSVVADAAAVRRQLPDIVGADGAVDVLLLDMQLRGETGLELLRHIRIERGLDLPVVVVTGQGSEDLAAELMRIGATDYVVKQGNYLLGLPQTLESAFNQVSAARDRRRLRQSEERLRLANAALEQRVLERTAELAAARDQAVRATQSKSQFLSAMSHELRTPMNAVLGFSHLLASDTQSPISLRQRDFVRGITQGGQHLMTLIDELLDMARIEAGKLQPAREPVDVAALVRECLALVDALAQAQQVVLDAAMGPAAACWATADALRLKQVLLNLLGNAIKYNRRGGQVLVAVASADGRLTLEVRDTGPGLSPAQCDRLFMDFERLDADGTSVPGAGIGLSLSRRLVELMGGEIGVDSVPGQGSRFWLWLPAATPPATADATAPAPLAQQPTVAASAEVGAAVLPPAAPARRRPAQPVGRVVYIEDDPASVALMRAALAPLVGVSLVCAEHPVPGWAAVQGSPTDLLLLDIDLPETTGFELLQRVRAEPRTAQLRVVAVSGRASPGDVAKGLNAGFDDYLTKPLDVGRLLQMLPQWLPSVGPDQ